MEKLLTPEFAKKIRGDCREDLLKLLFSALSAAVLSVLSG
jgi:hypothetical protein